MKAKKKICLEDTECRTDGQDGDDDVKISCKDCRAAAFKKAKFDRANICRDCLEISNDWPRPKGEVLKNSGPLFQRECTEHRKERFDEYCKKCRDDHVDTVGNCGPCANSRKKFQHYETERDYKGWHVCVKHANLWEKWQIGRWSMTISEAVLKKAVPLPTVTPELIDQITQVCLSQKP